MKPVKVFFFQYVFVSFLGAWRCITFYIISIKPHLFSQSQFMNKKQWIVQCHGPHFINCSPKLMFAGFNNQSPPHYLCLFSNLLTVKSTQNDKFAGLMQTISSLNFFFLFTQSREHIKWTKMALVTQVFLSEETRLLHSHHLWVMRFGVTEDWGGGGEGRVVGRGEGKISAPQ